jgi:hypothetical protein
MTYNSLSDTLYPSDLKLIWVALLLILVPSSLLLYFVIWSCEDKELSEASQYKGQLSVFYLTTLFLCLRYFYLVTTTEPGIIPAVSQNSGIPNQEQKKACNVREYYAEYMNKNELEV